MDAAFVGIALGKTVCSWAGRRWHWRGCKSGSGQASSDENPRRRAKLIGISKDGNTQLRKLFIHGARTVRHLVKDRSPHSPTGSTV